MESTEADQNIAARIADTIGIENRNGTVGGYQMLNCVKLFHKYLLAEVARIQGNFSGFGAAESGAVYIVRQVQNAITHFEKPVSLKTGTANILDT